MIYIDILYIYIYIVLSFLPYSAYARSCGLADVISHQYLCYIDILCAGCVDCLIEIKKFIIFLR